MSYNKDMKSQVLRATNLPKDREALHSVKVKPIVLLLAIVLFGLFLAIFRDYLLFFGIMIIGISSFSLFLLPNKVLIEFYPEYLVLYNYKDKNRCHIVYYDEIVSWKYERRVNGDTLVLNLVDGSSLLQDLYSKRSIQTYMDQFLPNKEVKNTNIKRAKA